MADQTLDQLAESLIADDADLLYVSRDGNDLKMKRGALVTGRVPVTRFITTTNGIKGGRDLGADVTLELDIANLAEDTTPSASGDYTITLDGTDGLPKKVRLNNLPGGGSSAGTSFSNIAFASGQTTLVADNSADTLTLTEGSGISITSDATNDAITFATVGLVPTSRIVSAGAGMTGGGTLAQDRSLAVSISTQSEDTSPDLNADYVMTHDSSTNALRKVRLALLSGTAYTLPIASPSTLGGIRLGSGLTADSNGVVSAASTYTLPAATTTTRGGITVGTGLTVNNGVLSNPNPTPYVPTIATVGSAGIVKPGSTLTIAQDGTLDVIGGSGGTPVSDGAYRPEQYGAIRGTGLSLAQRQANTAAINSCWAAAGGAKGRVDMGGGVFEIFGPLAINQSAFVITGDRCVIRQFQSSVNIVAASNVSQISFKGFHLTYQSSQTSGDNPTTLETYTAALRLSAVSDSNFEEIETTNAWVGIGVSASTASFNNTFTHCKTNLVAGLGYGLVHKAGTGSAFINVRVTGGGANVSVQGGVYLSGMTQCHFTQLTVEDISCSRPLSMVACQSITFSGSVFNNLKPTASNGYGGLIFASSSSGAQFAGSVISNTRLDNTGLGLTDASIYTGELGANFLATNVWVTSTIKTGTVRLALLGHSSASPARGVTGTFQQVRLDTTVNTPHRVDDLCYTTVDPSSESLDGPLLSYNNSFGSATGGFTPYTDDLSIIYPAVHGRYIRLVAPLTGNVFLTLSQYIAPPYANSTINSPRTYRGSMIRVERAASATGSFLATVSGHTGSQLTTLNVGARADFMWTGQAWEMLAGSSGGSGGGGTFATQSEAQAGISSTTYMSPLRTKDAINAYASANEISGTEGQVVGFNTAGDAVIVKNTRAISLPMFAETSSVVAGSGIRIFRLPIGIKLSAIELYTITSGSTATTVDVNLNGTSIFSSPPIIAGNSSFTSHTVFSTGTLPKGGVLSFDVDVPGSGARGLQVTLIGTEV